MNERGRTPIASSGFVLSLSWLTVFPVRGPESVDRAAGGRAIAWAPVVGALLGCMVALIARGATHSGIPAALAGVLAVAAHTLLTRGMHVDGLSDTVDGLGCYGPPERAREVMRSGGAGPFGVAALVLVFAAQALSIGDLAASGHVAAVVVAAFVSRVAVVNACGAADPAPGSGFGALVGATQSVRVRAVWTTAAILSGALIDPDRWWAGPIVVGVALAASASFTRHCVRRFGGIVGDVLGANVEIVSAAVLVGAVLVSQSAVLVS